MDDPGAAAGDPGASTFTPSLPEELWFPWPIFNDAVCHAQPPPPSAVLAASAKRASLVDSRRKQRFRVTKWTAFVSPRGHRKPAPLLPFVAAPSPYVYPSGPGDQELYPDEVPAHN